MKESQPWKKCVCVCGCMWVGGCSYGLTSWNMFLSKQKKDDYSDMLVFYSKCCGIAKCYVVFHCDILLGLKCTWHSFLQATLLFGYSHYWHKTYSIIIKSEAARLVTFIVQKACLHMCKKCVWIMMVFGRVVNDNVSNLHCHDLEWSLML